MNHRVLVGLSAAAVLMAAGCSDNGVKQGDLDDPVFLQSKAQWEAVVQQTVGSIDQTMDFAFNLPSDTIAPIKRARGEVSAQAAIDTFSYAYDPVTGWHVAYAAFSDSGVTGAITDSVQFQNAASDVQQDYDSATTDVIRLKQWLDVTADDSLISGDFAGSFDMTLSGLTGTLATAGGSASFGYSLTFSDTSGACTINYAFTEDLGEVAFSRPATENDGVCPVGGTLSLTGTVEVNCTSQGSQMNYNESWVVDVVFNNDGTMSLSATSGNTVWDYTAPIPCGNYTSPI